jgi:hypothetical protein
VIIEKETMSKSRYEILPSHPLLLQCTLIDNGQTRAARRYVVRSTVCGVASECAVDRSGSAARSAMAACVRAPSRFCNVADVDKRICCKVQSPTYPAGTSRQSPDM